MWPFNRKSKQFNPVNRLEVLLREAAEHPGARGEFMRQLFHFPLFALAKSDGQRVLFETKLIDNEEAIFVFTSLEALQYSLALAERDQTNYIEFKAFDLFRVADTNSFNMMLNSGHDYGRYFSHRELKFLLNPSPEESVVVEKNTKLAIGQPAKGYPESLIPALREFTARNKEVKNIHLGWIVAPEIQGQDNAGEYFAAVEFENGGYTAKDRVFKDLQVIAKDLLFNESMVIGVADKNYLNSGALLAVIPLK